jgi:DNA-binding transcriptional ArsR family regulator
MPLSRRRVTDAASLKALAHPLRLELLGLLVTEGPKTASEAAAVVGASPSNCSWHLRKLAEYGFVREARGAAGRNRPWRAVSEGLTWGDEDEADPETSAAADALTDMLLDRETQRLRAARAGHAQEPPEWKDATTVTQSQLWLTAEEAKRVGEQMQELFLTHADRIQDPTLRPDDARLVSLVGWLVPSREYPKTPQQGPTHTPEEPAS